MSRHIHIPQSHEWSVFLGNTAEIDNYLISLNEISKIRTTPAPRQLGLRMTDCCNKLWDFVTAPETPSLLRLGGDINGLLIEGGVAEGLFFLPESNSTTHPGTQCTLRQNDNPTYPNENTDFSSQDIPKQLDELQSQFRTLDEEIVDLLSRRFVPLEIQKQAAMLAWLAQYRIAYWRPFMALNGMTGRFITNSLRLRWSMTLWSNDIKKESWKQNLDTYSKLWSKKGSFFNPDVVLIPNLEKFQFSSR